VSPIWFEVKQPVDWGQIDRPIILRWIDRPIILRRFSVRMRMGYGVFV